MTRPRPAWQSFPTSVREQRAQGFTDFNDLATQYPEIVSGLLDGGP